MIALIKKLMKFYFSSNFYYKKNKTSFYCNIYNTRNLYQKLNWCIYDCVILMYWQIRVQECLWNALCSSIFIQYRLIYKYLCLIFYDHPRFENYFRAITLRDSKWKMVGGRVPHRRLTTKRRLSSLVSLFAMH